MSLKEIRQHIEDGAKKEAKSIHETASEERDAIVEEAQTSAKEIKEQSEMEAHGEIKRLESETEASIDIATRQILLGAREVAVDGETEKIKSLLIKDIRNSRSYARIFKEAMKSASELAPIEDLVIFVNKNDKDMIGSTKATIKIQDMRGGLIIYNSDSSAKIDASIERLIDTKSDMIKNELIAHMFHASKKVEKKARRKRPAKRQTKKRRS